MSDPVSPAGDSESAKVIAVVSSIPLAVDLGRYDLAEAASAPETVVGATSLWAASRSGRRRRRLMDAWRGLAPGLDAIRHELRDVGRASLDRRRALAADRRL